MRNPVVELEQALAHLTQLVEFTTVQLAQPGELKAVAAKSLAELQTLLDRTMPDLLEQIRQQQAQLEFQQVRLAALAQLDLLDTDRHDLSTTLGSIAQITSDLLPATGGASVVLWDALKGSFTLASSTAGPRAGEMLQGIHSDQRTSRWVVSKGEPVLIPDAAQDPQGGELKASGVESYAAFPILSEGKVLGVLYAFEQAVRRLSKHDVYFMQLVAHRAGIAIQNARRIEEVQQESVTDSLTGVFNRRHFEEVARLKGAEPSAVLLLDLDHFKKINDTHGHAVGDEVLRITARRLSAALRPTDTLARHGGEEFAVLLPKSNQFIAEYVAQRLHKALTAEPFETSAGDLHVTASFGVAIYGPGRSLDETLEAADKALYQAKRAGRNRVVVNSS